MMKLSRICIYPKDVQRITGKSEKSSRRLLHKIKENIGKESHQYVTTIDFAKYTGIEEKLVQEYLND
ncbi:hypothetical protein [Saccharicrinis aurantiacus]|uniref:hypothetical protein n=1 Tax=Saccharicrinis aurantiacus TaxID=1849719 RepID=UPI002492DFEC|nr:hypothetical protein [Saccharicrinis aurantiacus]